VLKALICTDGSQPSVDAACRGAALLSRPLSLTVLSVVDVRSEVMAGGAGLIRGEPVAVPVSNVGLTAEIDESLVTAAENAAAHTVEALGATGASVDTLVVHGDPAAEICRAAKEGGYDLLVVGSHGGGLVRRVFAGSVRDHVLQHAPCAVLVVRMH
jgi:nucleotide-binding universal stress UspA family protein